MISQIAIMILGASAIWLVGRKESWKRWGYILGMLSQPFWFYTAYTNEQWGILIMCIFYTYSWGSGIYNYWIKIDRNSPKAIAKRAIELFQSDFKCYEVHRPNIPQFGCKKQCNECGNLENSPNKNNPIRIEDFHIGFEYEQYELDSERYLNKGMIWVKKTYTMISPRFSKMQKLIDQEVIRHSV